MARPVTILVVDDEPPIRRLLRTSLTAQGYDVIEAESGAAALEAVERDGPDLLILDLGLPDMSGLEVIRALRGTRSLPIIVLSVREDERGKVDLPAKKGVYNVLPQLLFRRRFLVLNPENEWSSKQLARWAMSNSQRSHSVRHPPAVSCWLL